MKPNRNLPKPLPGRRSRSRKTRSRANEPKQVKLGARVTGLTNALEQVAAWLRQLATESESIPRLRAHVYDMQLTATFCTNPEDVWLNLLFKRNIPFSEFDDDKPRRKPGC